MGAFRLEGAQNQVSPEQNVQVVKQVYDAFQRGDIETLLSHVSDEIVFVIPGPSQMPTAGNWRGVAGMRQFFARFYESVEFKEFNVRDYVASGDRVITLGDYVGLIKRNTKTVASEWAMSWRLRDGKVVEFREFNDTLTIAEGFDAVTRVAAG